MCSGSDSYCACSGSGLLCVFTVTVAKYVGLSYVLDEIRLTCWMPDKVSDKLNVQTGRDFLSGQQTGREGVKMEYCTNAL